MSSRRLTISSLLCDDGDEQASIVPEPVLLAPHLRIQRHSPPPYQPTRLNIPQSSVKFGLDALVHAASQERRRLSASEIDILHRPPPSPELSRSSHLLQHPRSASMSPIQIRPPPFHHPTDDLLARHVHIPPSFSPSLPLLSRQLRDEDVLPQQRLDLQRQRQHHDQLMQQEQRHHQLRAQERDRVSNPRSPPSPVAFQQTPAQLHSLLVHERAPHKPASARKSDPERLRTLASPTSLDPFPRTSPDLSRPTPHSLASILSSEPPSLDDQQRFKKRRYSDTAPGDLVYDTGLQRDNITGTKERIPSGDFYRTDPSAGPPVDDPTSQHAVTETSGRKYGTVGFADVIGRAGSDRKHSGEMYPLSYEMPRGRRSPPGSSAGRAIAARKSHEEGDPGVKLETGDGAIPYLVGKHPPVEEDTKELRKSRPRAPSAHSHVSKSHYHPDMPPPQPQEDAHEWFLQHFNDPPRGPQSHIPPRTTLSSRPPPHLFASQFASSSLRGPGVIPTAPSVDSVDQELEQVVEQLEISRRNSEERDSVRTTDMDVDLAVTELVEQTFRDSRRPFKNEEEDARMEVDVEDELLSLLDDKPTRPSHGRRSESSGSIGLGDILAIHRRQQPPALKLKSTESRPNSPVTVSSASVPSPSFSYSTGPRGSSVRPTSASERASMPPPIDVPKGVKKGERSGTAAVAGKERKKPGPKPKPKVENTGVAPAKPRTKPGPKPKGTGGAKVSKVAAVVSIPAVTITSSGRKSAPAGAASRSRSTSVMPGGSVGPDDALNSEKPEEEEEPEAAKEDDKLYCVCKTKYEEDKCMIACDRCDEWYHTSCVNMPDLEVDLVDQFFCPPCTEKNPHLNLTTTYKQRCLHGLEHADPSSPKACHKPARGVFSKYCSKECGVRNMRKRIDGWTKKGGKKEELWDTVKNAEKREGVVYCVETIVEAGKDPQTKLVQVKPLKSKVQREVDRLNGLLSDVVQMREELKRGMEVILWRGRLLELAISRAEDVGACGWDQRLCFGSEEYAEYGDGVLESYETREGQGMDIDGEGEWWCLGEQECDRHAGWQALRQAELENEQTLKEAALAKLTTKEREIRRRMEDIDDDVPAPKKPLKTLNAKLTNGHSKGKANGDVKKSKKRKAPS